MTPWLTEKAGRVVRQLARLVDDVHSRDDLPVDYESDFIESIHDVLGDATKLLAFAAEAEWSNRDADDIVADGRAGLERVLVRYRLLSETTADRLAALLRDVRTLMVRAQSPARTELHAILQKHAGHEPVVEQLRTLLERVTNGDEPWDVFCFHAAQIIDAAAPPSGERK